MIYLNEMKTDRSIPLKRNDIRELSAVRPVAFNSTETEEP